MGLVHTIIEIINTEDITLVEYSIKKGKDIRKCKVKALVDSGAFML